MSDSLTITLAVPPRKLLPNGRCHWRKKSKATKEHRERAKLLTLQALNGQPAPAITRYSLSFYFKTARKRDDDNFAASCKAYRDGIADALRIDDHHLRQDGTPTMAVDSTNPRVEITLLP